MPCPHNEITIVQRSQRQSAVAAAAYQSGEKLFCEYDQQVKHYPEKRGIVHNEILLPANAPPEYADRNTLWNAAEAVEKQWNSQLARRWVLTIPREIPPDQYAVLVREFCEQQFVSKGMIVDFAIHDTYPPGHNPHAHVLLTMRAMDEHGKWLPKSRKVYDLDENGERIKLPSGRWKSHKEDTVDWNDQKYCEIWRHEWEVIQNRYLEANDRPERVDLRSYARQGLDITVVEGIRTKKMVADPIAADHVRLMFEMYAEPETSFGDITRYFEEQGIKIYEKSMVRSFLSQLLRNPVYAQADLELYEFFKSQGAAIVNDASDFAGTNGCYLYKGRDVKEDKDRCLKDQILVIAPHEALISSDTWLKCRKKLMANTTFQQGRKPKNTWLAGKIKCGHCGYALKATHVPNSTGYFRCTKRTENKGCPGCGKIRKEEFEQFIFSAMQEKFKDFQILHGREEKVNPKLTAYQVELAQVEAEIEKLLDTLTGANATLLAYANKKIEELDTRRQTISKAIAELSVETISPQQIKKLSYYLDNWDSIDFDDKRKAADGLISTIKATNDHVQIEWKI